MATATAKSVKVPGLPGVRVRYGARKATLLFTAMINGERFSENQEVDPAMMLDAKGRPTAMLKSLFNEWRVKHEGEVREIRASGMRKPTIAEVKSFYHETATARSQNPNYMKPAARTIVSTELGFDKVVEASGLRMDDSYDKLCNTIMLKKCFDRLAETVGGLSAWTYVQRVQGVLSGWMMPYYQTAGYKVERPVMPDVGLARKAPRYHRPSKAVRDEMDDFYYSLLEAEDRRLFAALTFVYQLAMRPCDVAELTKANFYVDEKGQNRLHYKPMKTQYSSGAEVNYPISACTWKYITEYTQLELRGEGEKLIPCCDSVVRRLNTMIRSDIEALKDSEKAVYEYRKRCIDEVYHMLDAKAACQISGDRQSTIELYYSEPFNDPDAKSFTIGRLGKEQVA